MAHPPRFRPQPGLLVGGWSVPGQAMAGAGAGGDGSGAAELSGTRQPPDLASAATRFRLPVLPQQRAGRQPDLAAAAVVPMIAAGSVYVLVEPAAPAAAAGPAEAGAPPSTLPASDDVSGALALLRRLRSGRGRLQAGPGGRCAATGRLAFYASPKAAERAGVHGLVAASVGVKSGPSPRPPSSSSSSTHDLITVDTARLPRPPTDALQPRHWQGRSAAAAWEALERRAVGDRMVAAATRLVGGGEGGGAGGAGSAPPPASMPQPASIVAVPLAVALDAVIDDADVAWCTLRPRPPALPEELPEERGGGGLLTRFWPGRHRRRSRLALPQAVGAKEMAGEAPPPSTPPPAPHSPALAAGAAPAFAIPTISLTVDTPAGRCRFTPLFLSRGESARAWTGARAAYARQLLAARARARREWRAGVEAGAVVAFGTGGRLVGDGDGDDGGSSDDEERAPPPPPRGGGGGGIRNREDDPPEVKDLEEMLRREVAAAAGGSVPPWMPRPPQRGGGGGRRRPPPWAGAPRPVQVVLALTATALTGAVAAAACVAEAAGDAVDAALVAVGGAGALTGLPARVDLVRTTVGEAAAAAAAANAAAAAAASAGGDPPPAPAWLGVQAPAPGEGGRALPRLSVAELAPPPTGLAAAAGSTAARPSPAPPAPAAPPSWEAVTRSVEAGVSFLLQAALMTTIAARLSDVGLGGINVTGVWTGLQPPLAGGGLPASSLRRLGAPTLTVSDDWARRMEAALAAHASAGTPVDPGLAAGLPGRPQGGGDGAGTGLLIVGDIGADGTASLPWPVPVVGFGDAAHLAWERGSEDDDDLSSESDEE